MTKNAQVNTARTLQHVMDWSCGEAYFAIVCGSVIVKRLSAVNWTEARNALAKVQS